MSSNVNKDSKSTSFSPGAGAGADNAAVVDCGGVGLVWLSAVAAALVDVVGVVLGVAFVFVEFAEVNWKKFFV